MKKRILSFLLAFAMLSNSVCCFAAGPDSAPYASLYLDGYAIGINPKDNLIMTVTFVVFGTHTMDCLGAQEILVEEWDGEEWIETATYPVSKNPDFYAYGASEHGGSVSFYGLPGVPYRATLTAYAELNGGSDTGTVTCNPKVPQFKVTPS